MKRASLAARAAGLILEKGPLSLGELVDELHAGGEVISGNYTAILTSAMWRRRGDLFEKKGKVYDLRVRDYELVD